MASGIGHGWGDGRVIIPLESAANVALRRKFFVPSETFTISFDRSFNLTDGENKMEEAEKKIIDAKREGFAAGLTAGLIGNYEGHKTPQRIAEDRYPYKKKLRHINVEFSGSIGTVHRIQWNPETYNFQFQSGTPVNNLHSLTPDSLSKLANLKNNPYKED